MTTKPELNKAIFRILKDNQGYFYKKYTEDINDGFIYLEPVVEEILAAIELHQKMCKCEEQN